MTSTTETRPEPTATPPTSTTPQVAVNDIGSAEDFAAAVDLTIKYFNDGDIVEGTIVKVDRDEVLLDIGYKTEGVIPSRELSIKHDVDPNEVVKLGDEVEALVLQKEDKEGRLILSKKRAQYERAWGTIEQKKENDEVVEGTVIEVVKGGLILDIGLRGFLPASLVEMRRVRDLQPYVGRQLEAKIIELDKNRNNVVLSRRAWLEQTQSEVRTEFLNKLAKGQVRTGVVSSIVNFGAFVDLGGVDGLVHVSELSWKHIDHPSEVVEVGQEVTVEVLDVDLDRERVSLSLKATQEDPWRQFARTHQIGQVVPGRVTKLVPFGAFVRVEEGIEGLVHISELAERHVEIPEQVVQVGQEILVKVIDIDLDRRRISLSLKQANEGAGTGGEPGEFDPAQYGMEAQYDDAGQLHLPGGLRPGVRGVARGLRVAARDLGEAVRGGPGPLRGARQAGPAGAGRGGRGDGGDVVHLGHRGLRRHAGLGRGAGGAAGEARGRSRVVAPAPAEAPSGDTPGGASAVSGRGTTRALACGHDRAQRAARAGGRAGGRRLLVRRGPARRRPRRPRRPRPRARRAAVRRVADPDAHAEPAGRLRRDAPVHRPGPGAGPAVVRRDPVRRGRGPAVHRPHRPRHLPVRSGPRRQGPAPVEVGASTYEDATSATDRVAATVASLRAGATSQATATIAGQPATVIGSRASFTAVVAQGNRTVAVTVLRSTRGQPDKAVVNIAEKVLANWGS